MFRSEKTLLKNISTIQTGYAMRGKITEDLSGSLSILQMKDVTPTDIKWKNAIKTNPISKKKPYFLKSGDVVFCGRGTRIFARPVIIEPERVAAGQQFFVISPHEGIPAGFIAWYINSTQGQQYLWKHAGGSSIINVTRTVLENLPVMLPTSEYLKTFTHLIQLSEIEKQKKEELITKRQILLENIISKNRTEEQNE